MKTWNYKSIIKTEIGQKPETSMGGDEKKNVNKNVRSVRRDGINKLIGKNTLCEVVGDVRLRFFSASLQ